MSIAELTRPSIETPATGHQATGHQATGHQATGHQVVVFPSRMVRSIPPFVFATPSGWVVDEAPGAVLAVRAAAAIDDFWSNALLIHDRVALAVDLQAAATASWGRLTADAPSAAVKMERVARFGGNVVYLRGVELESSQSGRRLAQLHALFFAPVPAGSKTADLFQFVATSTADQMAELGQQFVDMIATFRFT